MDHDASPRQAAQLGSGDYEISSHDTGSVRPNVAEIAGVSRRRARTSVALVMRIIVRTASRAAFAAEVSALVHVEAMLARRNSLQSHHHLHASRTIAEGDAS